MAKMASIYAPSGKWRPESLDVKTRFRYLRSPLNILRCDLSQYSVLELRPLLYQSKLGLRTSSAEPSLPSISRAADKLNPQWARV